MANDMAVTWRLVWAAGDAAEELSRYADPKTRSSWATGAGNDRFGGHRWGSERLAGHVTGSVTRATLEDMRCDVMLVPL